MRFANFYGFCEISSLPGCPQVAVSTSACIYPALRRRGHGRGNHRLRLERMQQLGYDMAICTVNATNKAEIAILDAEGWTLAVQFPSTNTGHDIRLYWRQILRHRAQCAADPDLDKDKDK